MPYHCIFLGNGFVKKAEQARKKKETLKLYHLKKKKRQPIAFQPFFPLVTPISSHRQAEGEKLGVPLR